MSETPNWPTLAVDRIARAIHADFEVDWDDLDDRAKGEYREDALWLINALGDLVPTVRTRLSPELNMISFSTKPMRVTP